MFKYRLSTGLSFIKKVRRVVLDFAARALDGAHHEPIETTPKH